MRATVLAGLAVAAAVAVGGCAGPSTVTLHGVSAEGMYTDAHPAGAGCARQEASNDPAATWKVSVAADGVHAATVPVRWQHGPGQVRTCTATWQVSVPPARYAYQVTLVAVCDDPFTATFGPETVTSVTVQPSAASKRIGLTGVAAAGNNR